MFVAPCRTTWARTLGMAGVLLEPPLCPWQPIGRPASWSGRGVRKYYGARRPRPLILVSRPPHVAGTAEVGEGQADALTHGPALGHHGLGLEPLRPLVAVRSTLQLHRIPVLGGV